MWTCRLFCQSGLGFERPVETEIEKYPVEHQLLWRRNPDGEDFLIRRLPETPDAWSLVDKFWNHPGAERREYYISYSGPPFTGSYREQIRERPGMYVGDIRSPGVLHIILEVISNSIDQFLMGEATEIRIVVGKSQFEVEDDGSGFHRRKAKHVLTNCHNTPTADNHGPHIHLSAFGIGLCPVNALCSSFSMESVDVKGGWSLEFTSGKLQREGSIERLRGTCVTGTVDRGILESDIPVGAVRRRCFDAVHLLPGLKIHLNDETFFAPDGLLALADFEAGAGSRRSQYQTEDYRFGYCVDQEDLSFTVACIGATEEHPEILSWVNGARTQEHGTHVDGALDALKAVGWTPAVVIISVVTKEPRYAGPTTERLGTAKVRGVIASALEKSLAEFIKKNGIPD